MNEDKLLNLRMLPFLIVFYLRKKINILANATFLETDVCTVEA